MTADDFRELALDLEGAVESAHMGHPDFRVNGRIFATLQANMESGAVMLAPDEQQEFLRTHPKTFTPASGAWGRQGSTMVRLEGAEPASVRSAMLVAWQRALTLPARKPARRKPVTHRTTLRKTVVRKSTVRKAAVGKSAVGKTAVGKTTARKTTARKSTARKATTPRTAGRKTTSRASAHKKR